MNIRSKLALGLSISTVMVSAPFRQTWPFLVWLLTALPLVWMLFIRRWRMAGSYVLIIFISYIDHIPALVSFTSHWPWPILLFLTIVRQVAPGFAIGLLTIQTTCISEYINGLSRMHIRPAHLAIGDLSFLPTIRAENAGIKSFSMQNNRPQGAAPPSIFQLPTRPCFYPLRNWR